MNGSLLGDGSQHLALVSRLALLTTLWLVTLPASAQADLDPSDPLGAGTHGRLLVPSPEIYWRHHLSSSEDSTVQLVDATAPVNEEDGSSDLSSHTIREDLGAYVPAMTVAGDFDGDGLQELARAEGGPGGSVEIFIPALLEDGTWEDGESISVADDGGPLRSGVQQEIQVLAGQFLPDRGDELAVAYLANDDHIWVLVYDVVLDSGRLRPVFSGASARKEAWFDRKCAGAFGTGLIAPFSIAAIDLGRDGSDEISLVNSFDVCRSPRAYINSWVFRYVFEIASDPAPSEGGASAHLSEVLGRTTVAQPGGPNVERQLPYFGSAARVRRVRSTAGDFNGDGLEDLAITLGYHNGATGHLRYSAVAAYLFIQTLERAQAEGEPPTPALRREALSDTSHGGTAHVQRQGSVELHDLASADLPPSDGIDDLIVVGQFLVVLEVEPASGRDGSVLRHIAAHFMTYYSDFDRRVLVGDIDISEPDNDELAAEIVVASSYSNVPAGSGTRGRSELEIFRFFGDELESVADRTADSFITLDASLARMQSPDLALADVDGDGFYLGRPSVYERTNVVQPVVILNAPPVHFDRFGSGPPDPNTCNEATIAPDVYDVSECWTTGSCEFWARYQQQSSQASEVEAVTHSNWTIEAEVKMEASAGVPGIAQGSIEQTIAGSYGEGFSKVETVGTSVSSTTTEVAGEDDRIFATIGTYTIAEYPIYAADSDEPFLHLMTVVPSNVRDQWFSSKQSIGLGLQIPPSHEPGNILSYKSISQIQPTPSSPIALDAFGELVKSPGASAHHEVGTNPSNDGVPQWALEYTDFSSESAENSSQWQISASREIAAQGSFKLIGVGGSLKLSGSYGEKSVSTQRVSVSDTVRLETKFGSVNPAIQVDGQPAGDSTYSIRPFAYWDTSGALVVDYAVDVPLPQEGSLWSKLYGGKPDLAFNLPWRNDHDKGICSLASFRERTRDIVLDPEFPEAGDPVTVGIRIKNYSVDTTSPARTAKVRIYLGHPDAKQEIGWEWVPAIAPREDVVVPIDWTLPEGHLASNQIFAVLDEEGALAEIHEDNNTGWNSVFAVPEPSVEVLHLASLTTLFALARTRRRA